VNPKGNSGFLLIVMCQCWFILGEKNVPFCHMRELEDVELQFGSSHNPGITVGREAPWKDI